MVNRATPTTDNPQDESNDETQPASSGATAIISVLEASGVDVLFGVQGGAIMPVYDALYDSEIEHVTMGHEQGAVHAADAYGVVAGEPGVCLATSGPGATNLVTGIADADMDSDPLLALTGQVPTELIGTDAFQETDTLGVTEPITKENFSVEDGNDVRDTIASAYQRAGTGRPGPTLVDLPKDVTQAELSTSVGEVSDVDTEAVPGRADADGVKAAALALSDATRPVILAGGGVIKGNASETLREFAVEYEIPVVTTMPGIGSFPEDHDLALEVAGMHGTGYANMALQRCDVMLAVGTRFDDRLTGGVETFAPDADIVHVDIDPTEHSKNVEATHPLLGDARTVLTQLDAAMAHSPDTEAWQRQCEAWKDEYPLTYDHSDETTVKPQFVVEQLDGVTPADTIVTTGVGQHQMWTMQFWTYTRPRTFVSSHGLGTMGYGLPAAIGATYAADPEQTVVCIEGDGSFLMTLQELAVAVREQLDITVVVLNNEGVGLVRQWQDAFFDGRRMASEYPWIPEFDTLAEAFGAKGYRITRQDEVGPVLEAAVRYDGPAVVDAHVDPEEDVYPLVPSGGDNAAFAMNEDQLQQL